MNPYTPPRSRLSYSNQEPGMELWNRNSGPSEHSFTPIYHHRQSTTPTPAHKASNRESWRVIAPPKSSERSQKTCSSTTNSPPSVKHLTCYFWAKNGTCKWNDDECLYAHHDTGKVANGPLQVEPGRPAVAGKNATTARPVYEDWRANHRSPPMAGRRRTIQPVIQDQLAYIAAKAERARSLSNSDQQQRTCNDHQTMLALGHSMEHMHRLITESQYAFHEVGNLLTDASDKIIAIVRSFDYEGSPHGVNTSLAAGGFTDALNKSIEMEDYLSRQKEFLHRDIAQAGLINFVPEWFHHSADYMEEDHAPES